MWQGEVVAVPDGAAVSRDHPLLRLTRDLARDLFGPAEERSFTLRFWDGSSERPAAPVVSRFTLVLRHPGSLRSMLLPPSELTIVRAFLRGDFEVEGDLEAASEIGDALANRLRSLRTLGHVMRRLLALPARDAADGQHPVGSRVTRAGRPHSRQRDAAAIRFHYDLSNDFYALWLDQRMVYTCGYFPTGAETLDEAQEAKLDHICRKLRLKPGERLLDIGCGWGGLVMHAAQRYGVRALGITLSEAQAGWAQQRIAASGLQARCEVRQADYRELGGEAPFDKVSSIGVVEHIGPEHLPAYFAAMYRLTRRGGLFLNHCVITSSGTRPEMTESWLERMLWRRGKFIRGYVFPDIRLTSAATVIDTAERAGFEARDVENLREHYALTLRQWVRRLEARRDEAVALVGEPAYRTWRLYMAAGARMQSTGKDGIIQVLLAKPERGGRAELPLTRADLYR